jgi:hypothetical protein
MLLWVSTHQSVDHQRSVTATCSSRHSKHESMSCATLGDTRLQEWRRKARQSSAPTTSFTKLIEWQVPASWLYPVTAAHHMQSHRFSPVACCQARLHNAHAQVKCTSITCKASVRHLNRLGDETVLSSPAVVLRAHSAQLK